MPAPGWVKRAVGMSSVEDNAERIKVLDGYHTPPVAVEKLLAAETIGPRIWDPCDGRRGVSGPLIAAGKSVFTSDVHRWHELTDEVRDFFDYESPPLEGYFDLVMNPPYRHALRFVRHSLGLLMPGCKAAFLLRIQFLEGKKRKLFFEERPPKVVHVFSERIPMMHRFDYEGDQDGNVMCYAWFVWEDGFRGETIVNWI